MIGKVNRAYRAWYVLRLNTGLPATGIASIDQTITIRNPGNTATMVAPTITEFGNGLYFFDISASFSNTHGAGTYGGAIEVDAPGVRDTALVSVDFFLRDFDDLAQPGDAMDLVTDAVDADAVAATGANEIRDTIISDAIAFPGASITEPRLAELDIDNIPTDIANIQSDIDNIQTRLPIALVGGRMDSDVGNMQADTITAAAIAADAIGSAVVSASAIAEIADGVWDELRADHVVAGSFGEGVLVQSINTGGVVATSFTAGAIDAAAIAADAAVEIATAVWSELLPAAFAVGEAGNILGNRLDVVMSTRSSHTAANVDALITGSHGVGSYQTAVGFSTLSIADVQTALTNQGYTTVRGLNLGNLDATIGSVNAAIGALNDIAALDVWNLDLDLNFTVAQRNLAGGALRLERLMTTNRLEEASGTPGAAVLFDDAGTTVELTWSIRPETGSTIGETLGSPARRGGAV